MKEITKTNETQITNEAPLSSSAEKFGYIFVVLVAFITGLAIGLTPSFRSKTADVRTNVNQSIEGIVGRLTPSKNDNIDKNIDFSLFWTVWNEVTTNYVDPKLSQRDMYYGAIKGMVSALNDPVTTFLTPDETKEYQNGNKGEFEGIGAELGYKEKQIIIVTPLEGSPAKAAGLLPGDAILAVDGKSTAGMSIVDAVSIIRGKSGTEVKLTIAREGSTEKEIKIKRGKITVASITYKGMDDDGIAVLDVDRFTEATLNEWEAKWTDAIDEIIADDPKALIVDLRGNPGGYFSGATYAAGEFLTVGDVIVQQKDRSGEVLKYTVDREGRLKDIELIVLVNEGSASASEIFAGAIQKNGRGKVLGENTFGKGTAQDVIDYPDGSSLHITVYKWLLPDGKWINPENPIKPDIKVVLDEKTFELGKDPQLDRAKTELKD
jgi:carboxyl-terminal processing protease